MNEWATYLYIGEFIGCVLFCILYTLRSRWWVSPMGVNVLAMMFVLAVLQGLSLLRLVIAKDWFMEHQEVLRFWSFLTLFAVVWWRVIILIMVQHHDAVRAHDDATGAHEDAVGARSDAAGAHEDAVTARDDARQLRGHTGDTDPELKKVPS